MQVNQHIFASAPRRLGIYAASQSETAFVFDLEVISSYCETFEGKGFVAKVVRFVVVARRAYDYVCNVVQV